MPCNKGKFVVTLHNKDLKRVNFYPIFKPSPDGSLRAMMMGGYQILLFPNDKVTVKGPWSNYRIDGSPFYKDLNKAESSYAGLTAMRDSIIKVAASVKADDEAAVNKISFEFAAVKQALDEAQIAYIRQHPTSLASALNSSRLIAHQKKNRDAWDFTLRYAPSYICEHKIK